MRSMCTATGEWKKRKKSNNFTWETTSDVKCLSLLLFISAIVWNKHVFLLIWSGCLFPVLFYWHFNLLAAKKMYGNVHYFYLSLLDCKIFPGIQGKWYILTNPKPPSPAGPCSPWIFVTLVERPLLFLVWTLRQPKLSMNSKFCTRKYVPKLMFDMFQDLL